MRKSTGSYPSLTVGTTAKRVVAHAGAALLAATAGKVGLDRELSTALRPWMRPLAIHDPGKVLLDLAISVAIGGDCLADIAQVRTCPGGPKGCGSSSAPNDPTPEPSCGSPMWTEIDSRRLPRTPAAGSCRIWNCATGVGPGARTASGTPRTPG